MGCKVSKLSTSKQKLEVVRSYGCESSIVELLKPECLKVKKIQNKRKALREEKGTTVSKLTLQDWLLTSPSFKAEQLRGGELCVLKHGSSKRIHPSVYTKATVSFSKDRLLGLDQVAEKEDYVSASSVVSSISRTQSGKSQNRVSFRLPEEAVLSYFTLHRTHWRVTKMAPCNVYFQVLLLVLDFLG